jgi:hypothetical protein
VPNLYPSQRRPVRRKVKTPIQARQKLTPSPQLVVRPSCLHQVEKDTQYDAGPCMITDVRRPLIRFVKNPPTAVWLSSLCSSFPPFLNIGELVPLLTRRKKAPDNIMPKVQALVFDQTMTVTKITGFGTLNLPLSLTLRQPHHCLWASVPPLYSGHDHRTHHPGLASHWHVSWHTGSPQRLGRVFSTLGPSFWVSEALHKYLSHSGYLEMSWFR